MRNSIICYINGERHELKGEHAFMTMADYLRYVRGLTGTKIVCAEGDCGACTTLVSRVVDGEFTPYVSVNSCIAKMYLYDKTHIITVEGLGSTVDMHPVQETFVNEHGAQCGYCTPGFICAMANMADELKANGKKRDKQKVKNYLTGNLCRCTGYEPIINAGMKVNLDTTKHLKDLYNDADILKDFSGISKDHISVATSEKEVFLPISIDQALKYKSANSNARMISGATDLGVVDNKGKVVLDKTLSLNLIDELYKVKETDTHYEVGAKVSLTELGKACEKDFPDFSHMMHIFASPQIKNVGTLVGNIVNASPIADTIPFLLVNEAILNIASVNGLRQVNVNDFYKGGYKELDLVSDELVTSVILPKSTHEYKLYKVSPRKDLDISTVTFAARYKVVDDKITDLNLAFGGVGPIVLRTRTLENMARDKKLDRALFKDLSDEVSKEVSPLSDHRGSNKYRYQLCANLLLRFGDEIMQNQEASI